MNGKKLALLCGFGMISLLMLAACFDDSDGVESTYSYHYDTTLPYDETVLNLDSMSSWLTDSASLESFYKNDSAFIETQDGKEILVFQSQRNCTKDAIKSVGVYALGKK